MPRQEKSKNQEDQKKQIRPGTGPETFFSFFRSLHYIWPHVSCCKLNSTSLLGLTEGRSQPATPGILRTHIGLLQLLQFLAPFSRTQKSIRAVSRHSLLQLHPKRLPLPVEVDFLLIPPSRLRIQLHIEAPKQVSNDEAKLKPCQTGAKTVSAPLLSARQGLWWV